MDLTALTEQGYFVARTAQRFQKTDGIVHELTVCLFRKTKCKTGTNQCIKVKRIGCTYCKIKIITGRRRKDLSVIQSVIIWI